MNNRKLQYKNRSNQRKWYESQKSRGIIYKVTCDATGDEYIGSTYNSLRKRLWQLRNNPVGGLRALVEEHGRDSLSIEALHEYVIRLRPSQLKKAELQWITKLQPSLNKDRLEPLQRTPHSYKGGVTYNGEWFPTKKALWIKYGSVPYGTFKSRLHYQKSVDFALGRQKSEKN